MHPVAMDDCPRCGAPRPHEDETDVRNCTYCGAPLPKRAPPRPTELPRKGATNWTHAAPIVGVLLLVTLGAVSAWRVAAPVASNAPEVSAVASPVPWVEPEVTSAGTAIKSDEYSVLPGLLLVPNSTYGDAVLVVLEPRQAATSSHQLALLNPSTGRALWQRPIEPPTRDGTVRAVLGGRLIVAGAKSLSGLDPATGEIHWQRSVEAAIDGLCATGKDVGANLTKLGLRAFASATGAALSPNPSRCDAVYSSRSAAPNFDFVDGPELRRWLPKGSTFAAARGLLPQRGLARVVLGKEPGNPASASVNVVTNRRWLWQATLAPQASTRASLLSPALAAVRLDRVVVPFVEADGHISIGAFNLATGERQWTRALGKYGTETLARPELLISLDGHVLFLDERGKLSALNLSTGTEEWSIGP
jgi:hypothetical protein